MGSNNNNNNNINMTDNNETLFGEGSASSGQIAEFFSGSKILITGGTGFVGKALVEKLLRSCPEISNIYLLIRPKRGLDVNTRYKELIKNPVFDRLRAEYSSSVFNKLVAIYGDVTEPGLGLSEHDRDLLVREVTLVFHSAATVRFNERLKAAVILNTLGTQRVVRLCRDMQKLQAFVHVSTAYSNADKREIQEMVYTPPADPEKMIHCCQSLDDEALDVIEQRLLSGKHPNTYTVTKAMAEWVVSQEAAGLPTAIVRPSIVTAAHSEPVPGWVDNVCGITGIMMEIGRGTIRSIVCDQKLVVDLIPVDFVVNTLIAVAWHTARHRPSSVCVYNCTSGSLNPVRWFEFGDMTHKHACESPTRHVMWYPGFTFRTNRFMHKLCELFLHFLPAFVVDIMLRVQGAKPIMLKISQRFKVAAKTGEFFSLHQFNFVNKNFKTLPRDPEFALDVSIMDWDPYVKSYMMGIRTFVLKDGPETLPSARRKLNTLYWVHRVAQVVTCALVVSYLRPLVAPLRKLKLR